MTDLAKDHYAVRIRPCKLEPDRFRWEIVKDGQLYATSNETFGGYGAAVSAANLARVKLADRGFRS